MAPSLSKSDSGVTTFVDGCKKLSVVTLENSKLHAYRHVFLSEVPNNITVTPSTYTSTDKSISAVRSFVGFDTPVAESRHVVPIGELKNIRIMSIFRFKVWWTTQGVGSNGRDLEQETQMVMLDKSDSGRPYVLLLPLIEGPFRASLQPGVDDNVDIFVESGSTKLSRVGGYGNHRNWSVTFVSVVKMSI